MSIGNRVAVAFCGVLLFATTGCGPGFVFPSLCDPRPESWKLAEAKRFDPYPDPGIGGGDMRGARPLGFTQPRPEPDLKAKEQIMLPATNGVAAAPPVVMPAPPTVSYPPGTIVSPPATSYLPAGAAVPQASASMPQVIYPTAGAPYVPAASPYPVAQAAYVVPTTNTNAGAVTTGATTTPMAYGKALTSP